MRLVFLYLSLVGIPILGLLGILRVGERLVPPVAVGGAWSIEVSPQPAGQAACGFPALLAEQPVLNISQSGPHLVLTLNDQERTTFLGELHGETLTAEGVVARAVTEASASAGVASPHLEASVDRLAEPGRLRGVLITNQCSLRTAVPFTAIRQPSQGQ